MNRFRQLKLIVADFDGVMTDNRVLVNEDGMEAVFCNRSDGLAVELLRERGIDVIVISKETNRVVAARCEKLGIAIHHGINDKLELLKKIIKERKLGRHEVCYVGNEVNDIECMKAVELSVAPADSHQSVLKIASLVTKARGGEGVIREISDSIL